MRLVVFCHLPHGSDLQYNILSSEKYLNEFTTQFTVTFIIYESLLDFLKKRMVVGNVTPNRLIRCSNITKLGICSEIAHIKSKIPV